MTLEQKKDHLATVVKATYEFARKMKEISINKKDQFEKERQT